MAGKEGSGHPRMSADYPTASSGQSEESKGLKESAQETASHLRESAEQLTERASEAVGQVRDKAREFVSGAREAMQERFSDLSGRTADIWEDTIGFVRRYPIASLAAAFGLGCLVCSALMMMPRRDDLVERA
jgi:ElaB/YqjD/DUF883 family membrane-anchored ribosome-binding protein